LADDVAKCRDHAESKAISALSNAHTTLISKVNTIKTTNTTLLTTLSTQSSALLLPLPDTEISTTTGIGEQIESFRARLAAAEKELERLWGKWDEAQGEIEKLGEEGAGVMKGWEEEVRERIAEMEGEVQEAGREAVKAVGEAEKVSFLYFVLVVLVVLAMERGRGGNRVLADDVVGD
jgi:septation ring formation regulator EzrA